MLLNMILIGLNLITSFLVIRLSRMLTRHKSGAEIQAIKEYRGKMSHMEHMVKMIDMVSDNLTSRVNELDDEVADYKTKTVLLHRALESIDSKKGKK